MGWMVSCDRRPKLGPYNLSLLIISVHVFLVPPMGKLPKALKVPHLPDQAFSSILSRLPNQDGRLSCKCSLMLLNFSCKFLCRNPILRPKIAHQSNHPCIIPL